MSLATSDISFVPVGPEHYDLLKHWLASSHVCAWWGDPETEFGYIRDMAEGRDTTRPFIFQLDGSPVGYIQYWFIGHHQNETWMREHPWLAELPPETIGVDLTVGVEENLSKGLGSRVLRQFTEQLWQEGHRTIIIDPDPLNHRAVRAYEKAGYRPLPHLIGRSGDSLIMRYEPSESSHTT